MYHYNLIVTQKIYLFKIIKKELICLRENALNTIKK